MSDLTNRFKINLPAQNDVFKSEVLRSNFESLKRANDFRPVQLPDADRAIHPLRVIVEPGTLLKNQDTPVFFNGTDDSGVPIDLDSSYLTSLGPDIPVFPSPTSGFSSVYSLFFNEDKDLFWEAGIEFDPISGPSSVNYPTLSNPQSLGDQTLDVPSLDSIPVCSIIVPHDRSSFIITNDKIKDMRPFLSTAKRFVDLEDISAEQALAFNASTFAFPNSQFLTGYVLTQDALDNSLLDGSHLIYLTGTASAQAALDSASGPSPTSSTPFLTGDSNRQAAITSASSASGSKPFLAGVSAIQAALDAASSPTAVNHFLTGTTDAGIPINIQGALTNPTSTPIRAIPTQSNPFATLDDIPAPIGAQFFDQTLWSHLADSATSFSAIPGTVIPSTQFVGYSFFAVSMTGNKFARLSSVNQNIPTLGTRLSNVDVGAGFNPVSSPPFVIFASNPFPGDPGPNGTSSPRHIMVYGPLSGVKHKHLWIGMVLDIWSTAGNAGASGKFNLRFVKVTSSGGIVPFALNLFTVYLGSASITTPSSTSIAAAGVNRTLTFASGDYFRIEGSVTGSLKVAGIARISGKNASTSSEEPIITTLTAAGFDPGADQFGIEAYTSTVSGCVPSVAMGFM